MKAAEDPFTWFGYRRTRQVSTPHSPEPTADVLAVFSNAPTDVSASEASSSADQRSAEAA